MLRSTLLLLFNLIFSSLSAQHLDKEFHKQRREEFRKLMPPNSVAIFFGAEEKVRSNDVNYRFHQDPDFYYLSGYKEPKGIILIFKNSILFQELEINEIIFVRPKDANDELWNGERLGVQEAKKQLGFQNVFPIDSAEYIYKFIQKNNTKLTELPPSKTNSFMSQLREVKTPLEIQMLQKAIDISCIGQIETMKAITPKMTELEAQGIHEFVFKKFGCQEVGYPSIVGAGNNSCVLHYIESKKDLKDGELILMDVGAEYEGYTADVTRTIPVNGKFTEEQKILYNLVKKAQEAAFEECEVENNFNSTSIAAQKVIAQGLLELGIIKKVSEVSIYFPHGTSHYLGLDVHDKGTFGKFKANTIITVEPGIYIPKGSNCDKKWWGIGIRIEDDIWITENNWINLSKNAPRSIEEIEELMKETSPLNDFNLKLMNNEK